MKAPIHFDDENVTGPRRSIIAGECSALLAPERAAADCCFA